jgi:hypothetical protein
MGQVMPITSYLFRVRVPIITERDHVHVTGHNKACTISMAKEARNLDDSFIPVMFNEV